MAAEDCTKKRCSKCGTVKSLSEFYKRKNGSLRSACKSCCNDETRRNRAKNPDQTKQVRREYYLNNIERHKAVSTIYRANNVDKLRVASKNWYEQNIERIKKHRAEYRDKTRDKRRLDGRERYKKNPAKYLEYWHVRRAKKTSNGGAHTAEQISDLKAMQKCKCATCKASIISGFHIDHIIPLSKGGSNDIHNIQLLCKRCNLKKSNKDPIEFMQEQGFLI